MPLVCPVNKCSKATINFIAKDVYVKKCSLLSLLFALGSISQIYDF